MSAAQTPCPHGKAGCHSLDLATAGRGARRRVIFTLLSDLNPNKPEPVITVAGRAYSLRNDDICPRVLAEFAAKASRATLIRFAEWNDRNGCFNDDDHRAEFGHVASTPSLRATVREMLLGE